MELTDGIKTTGVTLKRGNAEVFLLDVVTLKKALLIHSYSHDIFSVKVTATNRKTVIFKGNKNPHRHKQGIKFEIHEHKIHYNLMTPKDKKNTMDSCRGWYDIHHVA